MTIPSPPPSIWSFARHWRDTFGAVLMAMLAEALLLLGVAVWLTRQLSAPPVAPSFGPLQLDLAEPPTPEPPPFEEILADPASEPAPADREPSPREPEPEPEPDSSEASSRPVTRLSSPRAPAPMPLPDTSALPRRGNVGPSRPAPPEANGQARRINEFVERLNAALRSASRYPEEARGMKLSGRVHISVHYRDGRVWAPSILRSSGFPILDRAVLEGVVRAEWPPPPPGLEGREIVVPITGSFW